MAIGTNNEPGDAGDTTPLSGISEFLFQHFFTDGTMCFLDDTTGCYVMIESYQLEPLITYDIDPETGRQNKPSTYAEIWSIDLDEFLSNGTVVIEVPGFDNIPDGVTTFHRAALARYALRHGAFVKPVQTIENEPELTDLGSDFPLDTLDFGHDPLL